MRSAIVGIWIVVLGGWICLWGLEGISARSALLLHWPMSVILLAGFVFHLQGGLIAACLAVLLGVGLTLGGWLDSWMLLAWQALIYWVVGLYPYKFMQVQEQRRHHYGTLTEYKRGEIAALQSRLEDVSRRCQAVEEQLKASGGIP